MYVIVIAEGLLLEIGLLLVLVVMPDIGSIGFVFVVYYMKMNLVDVVL